MYIIKTCIFLLLILYASISDIKKREVSGFIPLCILITGLINTNINELPMMLLAMIFVSIPSFIVAMNDPSCYGGADIKFMGACAFVLGIERGILAMILGLSIGIITTKVKRKIKKQNLKEAFPVVPCLAIGTAFSYFI
ncbi:MAG: A24 family peptidase [Clostridia bacterium]